MGSSGAGKTTLMDVIACRKTVGRVTGRITANGAPVAAKAFAPLMGYVEQSDVHAPLQTVGEALRFAARLRLPATTPARAREALVRDVMRLVELEPLDGALVGRPGVDGLSTEQRKRLTIALELVTNPPVLFCDEPSTGLDSRAAAVVMGAVRAVAASGRTVVCTIHQPGAQIFALFDELLLLQRGGSLVYAGPAGGVVDYLSGVPGAPAPEAGRNPASWMMEAVAALCAPTAGGADGAAAAAGAPSSALVDAWRASPLSKANEQHAVDAAEGRGLLVAAAGDAKDAESGRATTAAAAAPAAAAAGRRPGMAAQLAALLRRNSLAYWRDPGRNVNRFLITLMVAMLIGLVELGKGSVGGLADARAVQNAMGALYM